MTTENILDAQDLELLRCGVVELLCTKQNYSNRQRLIKLEAILSHYETYARKIGTEIYACPIKAGDTWRCQVCGGPQQL